MSKKNNLIALGFNAGLFFKGVNAVIEIICGIVVFFLSPDMINNVITRIAQHELSEDPTDFFMNYLINFGHRYTIDTQLFMSVYFLFDGMLSLVVALLLWRKKMWAYPFSAIAMILFIGYQIYHFLLSHSQSLLLFIILNAAMVVLTIYMYKKNSVRQNGI